MLAEIPLEVVADYYPAFKELDEYRGLEILSAVPTVVIGCENDMITPIEHTARIIELLPNAEAIRVENSGHLGIIEKHDIFNGALDRLLARVRAERGLSIG
jgi:pimeloyl-ACP methyl ester carboxylesterase